MQCVSSIVDIGLAAHGPVGQSRWGKQMGSLLLCDDLAEDAIFKGTSLDGILNTCGDG